MVDASDNGTTLFTDELLLVGRDQELASFRRILDDKQSLLVVLTGGPGVGKTSLLQKFRALAEEAGWNTALLPASSSAPINLETTPESFSTYLQTLLSVPSSKSFIEKPGKDLVDPATGQPLLLPIVERLRALTPFLLLIDGYNPGPEFQEWFRSSLLGDVKKSPATIVIVVSERPEGATKITPIAEQIIQLGALDEHSIGQHFQELGHQLSPPMGDEEIQAYIEASKNDPQLLGSLTRVLRLALPS